MKVQRSRAGTRICDHRRRNPLCRPGDDGGFSLFADDGDAFVLISGMRCRIIVPYRNRVSRSVRKLGDGAPATPTCVADRTEDAKTDCRDESTNELLNWEAVFGGCSRWDSAADESAPTGRVVRPRSG